MTTSRANSDRTTAAPAMLSIGAGASSKSLKAVKAKGSLSPAMLVLCG